MSVEDGGVAVVRIGGVDFDPTSGELIGPDQRDRLAPQPARLLALFADHVDEVVSRDEIREHLWPDGKVEYEQGIAFAVSEIRKGLTAVGGDPSLLQTIPKRGYRLRTSVPDPVQSARARREYLGPLVGFVLFAAVFASIRLFTPFFERAEPVIVLFAHETTAGSSAARVGDALAEALTTGLTESLRGEAGVVGPTGTANLVGPDDMDGAREFLDACLVVSGTIRDMGVDSVVVFTQIVRSSDRVHVWAEFDTAAVADAVADVVADVTEGTRASLADCR